MPNIVLKVPSGSFSPDARSALVQKVNEAAAAAERIPAAPRKRSLCWVVVEEVAQGLWTCGTADITAQVLPCIAIVYVPAGVLDATARSRYVQAVHGAFKDAALLDDRRALATSVILQEVDDGAWGVNGAIWTLPTFARVAGFEHLQHLVAAQ